jgi:hypothetical protein
MAQRMTAIAGEFFSVGRNEKTRPTDVCQSGYGTLVHWFSCVASIC